MTAQHPIAPAQAGTTPDRYDRAATVNECRFFMGQSAEAMLEAGKRLIRLKDNEPHGEFERIVEEELNLSVRTARVMMQAAAKFLGQPEANRQALADLNGANAPALTLLEPPKRSALAVLGKTKLFELMTESDDDLEELAQGGTLAGHTLDEIDRMTSRELKAALRKSRQDAQDLRMEANKDLQAARKVADDYARKLREAQEQALKQQAEEQPDQTRLQCQRDLHELAARIAAQIRASLLARCAALLDAAASSAVEHAAAVLLVGQALGQVANSAHFVGDELGIAPSDPRHTRSFSDYLLDNGLGDGQGAAAPAASWSAAAPAAEETAEGE